MIYFSLKNVAMIVQWYNGTVLSTHVTIKLLYTLHFCIYNVVFFSLSNMWMFKMKQTNNHTCTCQFTHKDYQYINIVSLLLNKDKWYWVWWNEMSRTYFFSFQVCVEVGCLMPLSIYFSYIMAASFYWWRKPEYPEKTNDWPQVTD
jgi:hypothetical protein